MKHILSFIYLLVFLILSSTSVLGQKKQYVAEPMPFSSIHNDFAPMWYKDGLVYCSTFKEQSILSIFKKKTYTLFYTDLSDSTKSKDGEVFSYELISRMNDGPITFSKDLSLAFFNRNHKISSIFKNFPDSINPLGIFSAELIDNKWRNIESFPYNSPHYSLLTPMLSNAGDRLYFASDMPGGYGGTDLYYSEWDGTKWLPPVNMGEPINTKGNESYPYITKDGKLFFTSDGHEGFGGKDIFFTQVENGKWSKPINLGADVNTPFDDFGLIINNALTEGYFTSDRENFDNIYRFKKEDIKFEEYDYQTEQNFCYTFVDDYIFDNKDTTIKYIWEFENDIIKEGAHVYHCFSKTGNHDVFLTIADKVLKDSILFTVDFNVDIKQINQPYISSPTYIKVNETTDFNANNSHIPHISITNYFWKFDDTFLEKQSSTSYSFKNKGEKSVVVGIAGFNRYNNKFEKLSIAKRLFVYDNLEEILSEHSESFEDFCEQLDPFYKKDTTKKSINISFLNSLNPETKIYIHNKIYDLYQTHQNISLTKIETSPILKEAINIIFANRDLKLEILISSDNSNLSTSDLSNFIENKFNIDIEKRNIIISEAQMSNKSNILQLVFK